VPLTNVSAPADTGAFGGGLEIDAAVHADAIGQLPFAPPRLGLLDFGQRFVDEFLPAKTGIHRHDEQQVNLIEIRLDLGDGGGRVDGEADLFAERFDFPDQRRDLFAQFNVNDDFIRARPGEWLQQNVRSRAHEMNVEE